MAPQQPPRSGLELDYPFSLGVFSDYAEAQKAVDYLSDEDFPVQNCLIVGTDLKQVERITGRLTYGRAAAAGAVSGAWLGAFVGLALGIFAEGSSWVATVVSTVVIGAAFGMIWGVLGYAMTGGRRDFTSVSRVVPSKFEVLVEHQHLARAQQLLAVMPGRPVDL